MIVLHITPETNGYEKVELLANQIDRHNSLAAIKKDDIIYYTGGFIINDTPEICAILDTIPKDKQYEFVKSFKMDPFVAFYYDDTLPKEKDIWSILKEMGFVCHTKTVPVNKFEKIRSYLPDFLTNKFPIKTKTITDKFHLTAKIDNNTFDVYNNGIWYIDLHKNGNHIFSARRFKNDELLNLIK